MVSKTFTHDKNGIPLWFIRTNNGSRTFTGKKYGNIRKAEKAADIYIEAYTKKHPDEKRRNILFRTQPSKRSKTGISGVYRSTYLDHNILHNYWCANIPRTERGTRNIAKRFCVETYGEDEAKKRAAGVRKEWECRNE
jgi:hypothetical protein